MACFLILLAKIVIICCLSTITMILRFQPGHKFENNYEPQWWTQFSEPAEEGSSPYNLMSKLKFLSPWHYICWQLELVVTESATHLRGTNIPSNLFLWLLNPNLRFKVGWQTSSNVILTSLTGLRQASLNIVSCICFFFASFNTAEHWTQVLLKKQKTKKKLEYPEKVAVSFCLWILSF